MGLVDSVENKKVNTQKIRNFHHYNIYLTKEKLKLQIFVTPYYRLDQLNVSPY